MTGLYVASNVTALGAQHGLTRNLGQLADVMTRLSSGLRINSGKDDPAGLIASELLKADITGTKAAITNTQRANGMIATADAALGQISSLLNDIKGLVVESANTGALNDDQIMANQLIVDASIDAIDRISKSTNYVGKKLLDGSLGFTTDGTKNSGISNLVINAANMGSADSLGINVTVSELARAGTLVYNGAGTSQPLVLDIGGSIGSKTFMFGSEGAYVSNAEMANAINSFADTTGVQAYVEGVAQRGSVVLSSAGSNNDILITSNTEGFDAGNYSFRIVEGSENNARIVSDPIQGKPGVVEISLVASESAIYTNFAGLFNIEVNSNTIGGGTATSVTMTQGKSNTVNVFTTTTPATGQQADGTAISLATVTAIANADPGANQNVSQSIFNGWTIVADNQRAGGATATDALTDFDAKTVYVSTAATATDITNALETALGVTMTGDVTLTLPTTGATTLKAGDRITLGGGGTAGEVFITYKEGATAGDIQTMLKNAGVNASLASGVAADKLIPNVPSKITHDAKATTVNPYVSGATSQEVINLINQKLGDKFTATSLKSEGNTNGFVSYMDASAVYGDIGLDNAVRFSGMDNGPVIRLVADGANQSLGISIIKPSDADIAAGIHTPILQINLATDANGSSITTAKDIADLFSGLNPNETLGVSATVFLPPGVDPNGRTWVTDVCNNVTVYEDCSAQYGLGFVQPTQVDGVCGPDQNDIVLLGFNEAITASQAVARIPSFRDPAAVQPATTIAGIASGGIGTTTGTTILGFGNTSALNGITFGFTLDPNGGGFNAETGNLTFYIDPATAALTAGTGTAADDDFLALETIINSTIAANWESIREYTGATGDPTKLDRTTTVTGAHLIITDAVNDARGGRTTALAHTTFIASESGLNRGVGAADPSMLITAKQAGTEMAGVKISFVQDNTTGLTTYTAGDAAIDISVEYDEANKQLVVRGNLAAGTSAANAMILANALNSDSTFNQYFTADATVITGTGVTALAQGDTLDVAFSTNQSAVAAQTMGGYRVDPAANKAAGQGGTGTGWSSGILMTGQSDSNERLVLQATEVGSNNFVKVDVRSGSFNTYCPLGYEKNYLAGSDMVATINGMKASADGNNISINSTDLSMSMTVDPGVYLAPGQSTGFTITGGGATFQLGPDVVSGQQIRVGIGAVDSTHLGGNSGMLYMLKSGEKAAMDTNTKLADRIVSEAISSVATTRGRLGALQRGTLDPNISALETSLEQLVSANASIEDADFAEESSRMMQFQILVQAGLRTLSIANQFPQYAAQLIG